MDHTQLEQLARAIAQQSVLDAWPYWLSLLALVYLGVVAGSFLGSYFAKRGALAAARADREEILSQLRATTRAAEETKSAISLSEWSERDRRILRRTRLEELLLLAWKTRQWLSVELDRVADPSLPERPSPQDTLRVYARLYFPELREEARAYERACDTHIVALGQTRVAVLQARLQHPKGSQAGENAAGLVMAAAKAQLMGTQAAVLPLLYELEDEASQLMATLIEPERAG
jgi:hypothetical protein